MYLPSQASDSTATCALCPSKFSPSVAVSHSISYSPSVRRHLTSTIMRNHMSQRKGKYIYIYIAWKVIPLQLKFSAILCSSPPRHLMVWEAPPANGPSLLKPSRMARQSCRRVSLWHWLQPAGDSNLLVGFSCPGWVWALFDQQKVGLACDGATAGCHISKK